jgi:hypothetical protein
MPINRSKWRETIIRLIFFRIIFITGFRIKFCRTNVYENIKQPNAALIAIKKCEVESAQSPVPLV